MKSKTVFEFFGKIVISVRIAAFLSCVVKYGRLYWGTMSFGKLSGKGYCVIIVLFFIIF